MKIEMQDHEWIFFLATILTALVIAEGVPSCTAYNIVHDIDNHSK